MRQIQEYIERDGRCPFQRWYDGLDNTAALKVTVALARLQAGNLSALKSVGQGVHEVKIDFGPGYRVYIGMDGPELVLLLGGSAKARQSQAIRAAQVCWAEYRRRKQDGA